MKYCDYDAIVHYDAGEFNKNFKSILTGNIIEINKEKINSDNIVNSFLNCEYKTYKTTSPIILYRVFGAFKDNINNIEEKPRGARMVGAFASTEFAESMIDAKIRLALNPAWLNTKMYEAKLIVPKDVILNIGKVAPVKLKSGTILTGGADQILLPFNWSIDWIVGFRRVTGRQLQAEPSYPLKFDLKTFEHVNEKKFLYNKICPLCGFDNIESLSEDNQIVIKGIKGNSYTMKYHCNNKKCNYYW